MKAFKLLILFILITSCSASKVHFNDLDEVSKTITINESKDDLFVKSNLWLVDSFVSAKSVLQYSDKEAGVLAGKYTLMEDPYRIDTNKEVEAVIKIFSKEGSVKVVIKVIPYQIYQSFSGRNDMTKNRIIENVNRLMNDLEDYLKTTNL